MNRNMKAKFIRGEDPKKSLGIGINSIRHAKTVDDVCDFIIRMGPAILGEKDWPEDTIKEKQAFIKDEYFLRIRNWGIDIPGWNVEFPVRVRRYLRNRGYDTYEIPNEDNWMKL